MPSTPTFYLTTLSMALLLPLAFAPPRSPAQASADAAAGCTLHRGLYTCNWQTFRAALDAAHTVRIETQGIDRSTAAQLRRLAQSLRKSVVPDDQAADLTLLLIPVEPNGIDFGPGGRDLATLSIYAPGPNTTRGTLLWAETYRGQPDRPWPAVAHATIEQFQARLPNH